MTRKIVLMFMLLLFAGTGYADKIILKNGKEIQGDITNESKYSVRIRIRNIPHIYYRREIRSIERDKKEAKVVDIEELDSEEKRDILHLLEINGTKASTIQMFEQIIRESPAEKRELLRQAFSTEQLLSKIVPIYAVYFTKEEIKELIEFYESPIGQKQLQTAPDLINKTLETVVDYFHQQEVLSLNPLGK